MCSYILQPNSVRTQTGRGKQKIPSAIANDRAGIYLSSSEVHGLDYVLENYFLERQQRLSAGPTFNIAGYRVPAGPDIDVDRWINESSVLVAIGWAKMHDVNVSVHFFFFSFSAFVFCFIFIFYFVIFLSCILQ